ncbi:MAG: hypothetical protein ACRETL_07810 [Gammaproteobacteria bacterium]
MTIKAIADTVIQDMCATATAGQRGITQDYILKTVESMPDYFSLGFKALATIFGLWSVPRYGRLFHRLPPAQRLAQLVRWRDTGFGFQNSMVAFYTTFVAFGLNSELHQEADNVRSAAT